VGGGGAAPAASPDERIRAPLVGPHTESVIELVFSTGAGVYRVRRTPARGLARPPEAAAIAYLDDLDDTELRQSPYYPKDIVDWAREQKRKREAKGKAD